MNFAIKNYQRLVVAGTYLAPVVLLIIRVAWGWELVESGWGHLHDVDEMAKRFTEWGIPHPVLNVYVSATTEMVGGALWILGLGARIISIPLLFNFCVAY